MTPLAARELADDALHFVATDPDLAAALLAASGAEAGGLRKMAVEPEFALFLLDFLLENDARVVDFATAAGVKPTEVMAARQALSGPEDGWD
ncbi:DUF3572 family protein [Paracoccus suum]|uniref:DUF3572 family protein n=1 Tax=Paracoccus suum TaxID=2259340 RepID=A0A344PL76_9RHOB|nr:DUF3572 family protein [Paracoccus suum]AXC50131.1 DUF3572 family protein [Paracoccus suum]